MVRVWVGVGIVALVLLGAVGWAAAQPGAAPGSAVAAPPPGPPAAGDCLLEDPWLSDEAGRTRGPLPALRVAACDGARYGEVVTVGAGTDLSDMWDDGTWDQCWSAVVSYLGLPNSTGSNPDRYPTSSASPTLIGPDARQRAAGQDWSACVVGVPPAGETDAAPAVNDSLRGSWQRDEGRLFALCLDDDETQEPVSCGRPHGFEQVSYWEGDPDRSADDDAADCRRDAIDALGATDGLDSGALQVVVVHSAYDDTSGELITGAPARAAAGGFTVDCMLAPAQAGRELVGPLRGVGDGPVPFR